jgi:hypothetical protein
MFMSSCLDAAEGDSAWAAELIPILYAETVKMLNDRNDAWSALVVAVLERGRLEESEIIEILGRYPEVSPETQAARQPTMEKMLASGRAVTQAAAG